jgi:hypothetical protein
MLGAHTRPSFVAGEVDDAGSSLVEPGLVDRSRHKIAHRAERLAASSLPSGPPDRAETAYS